MTRPPRGLGVRWLATAFILATALCDAPAIEGPITFSIGTNYSEFPPKAQALWIAPSGAIGTNIQISPVAGGQFTYVVPAFAEPTSTNNYQQDAVWPWGNTFFASRTLVDGRWTAIRTVVLGQKNGVWTNLSQSVGVVGALKKDGVARFQFTVKGTQWGDTVVVPRRGENPLEPLFLEMVRRSKKNLPKKLCHPIRVEVIANRLGSQLDPVLRIFDREGNELAFCDDDPYAGRDSRLLFLPPKEDDYILELRDVANGTGPDFFYYLTTSKASWGGDYIINSRWTGNLSARPRATIYNRYESATNWSSSDALRLEIPFLVNGSFKKAGQMEWFEIPVVAGQKIVASVETRRFNSPCDAKLALFNDAGESLAEAIGSESSGPSITNRFSKDGFAKLRVSEISRMAGVVYWLSVKEGTPGVSLTADLERLDFSKEGEAKIKIACARYDYDGPVNLEVDGLPEGVSVVDSTIPEKKSEGELKLKRNKDVPAFQIRIRGKIEQKDAKSAKEEFPVSTMPALKKLFPLQMFPCAAMDGWIAVNPSKD